MSPSCLRAEDGTPTVGSSQFDEFLISVGFYTPILEFYNKLPFKRKRLGYVFTLKLLMSGWASRRHDIIVINRKEKDREYGWSRSSGMSSW